MSRTILHRMIDYYHSRHWIPTLALVMLLTGIGSSALNQRAVFAAPQRQSEPYASSLIISEYIDGSNNDKAVEIYNGTNSIITLSDYVLEVYDGGTNNGSVLSTFSFRDEGVAPIGVGVALVIVNSNASGSMQISGSIPWDGLIFDGDDAIVLRNMRLDGNNVVDSIGQLNRRGPWSNQGVSTKSQGLRRKPHVCHGRRNADAPFDPSIGWTTHSNSDYTNLGLHTVDCTKPAPDVPIINEFVFRHVGGGDPEYIEVKGASSAPYERIWILVINGNAESNPGRIEHAFETSTLPVTNGVYRTVRNRFEDGTKTILLVRDFFGATGQDIDPFDDGIITNPLWNGRPLDGVSVLRNNSSNDLTYSGSVVLGPYFDGKPEPPGGASRYPDDPSTVVNTYSINAWVRNDFNGNGLSCDGCSNWTEPDEAINTPGQRNRLGGGPLPTGTVTPTATVTRTPGPLPANCINVIVNGGFEQNHEGWKFGDDPVPARYTGDQHTEGMRSVLLGNPPGAGSRNVVSFSSIRQLVKIPSDATVAYLTWEHLSQTQEAATSDPGSHSDRQDMIILAPNQMPMAIKYRARINETDWESERSDLTEFIGKNFYVYFNAFNDGNGKRTWMYLDDVQLVVCYPPGVTPGAGAATPTPMDVPTLPATLTPTATQTSTPTPTATTVITDVDRTATPTVTLTPTATGTITDTDSITDTDVITDTDGRRAIDDTLANSLVEAVTNARQPSNNRDGPPQLSAEGCLELVINGGFERKGIGWTIPSGTEQTEYTSVVTYDGSRQSMRVASLDGPNINGISSVVQVIDLPPDFEQYELSFQYYPVSDPDPGPGDLQYSDIHNQFTGQFEMRVLSVQENDRSWKPISTNLDYLAGEQIRLEFSVNNDGVSGRSAMYVDNVSLKACGPPEGGYVAPTAVTSGVAGGSDGPTGAVTTDVPTATNTLSNRADADRTFAALSWLGPLATWLGVLVVIALLVWGIIFALRANGTSGSTTDYQGRAPAAPTDDQDADPAQQDSFGDDA